MKTSVGERGSFQAAILSRTLREQLMIIKSKLRERPIVPVEPGIISFRCVITSRKRRGKNDSSKLTDNYVDVK